MGIYWVGIPISPMVASLAKSGNPWINWLFNIFERASVSNISNFSENCPFIIYVLELHIILVLCQNLWWGFFALSWNTSMIRYRKDETAGAHPKVMATASLVMRYAFGMNISSFTIRPLHNRRRRKPSSKQQVVIIISMCFTPELRPSG